MSMGSPQEAQMMEKERWNKIITTFENQRATCQFTSKILSRLSVVRKAIVFMDFKTSKDSMVKERSWLSDLPRFKPCCSYLELGQITSTGWASVSLSNKGGGVNNISLSFVGKLNSRTMFRMKSAQWTIWHLIVKIANKCSFLPTRGFWSFGLFDQNAL